MLRCPSWVTVTVGKCKVQVGREASYLGLAVHGQAITQPRPSTLTYVARYSSPQRSSSRRAETPYGPVLQHMDLTVMVKDIPTPYRWPYLNPFATLYYACKMCIGFAILMRDALRGGIGHIMIYADEVTPGNVLRPDSGKKSDRPNSPQQPF